MRRAALAACHHDGVRGLTDPGSLRAVDEPAGKVKVRASGPVHFNLEERERERAVAATSDSVSCVGCVDWSRGLGSWWER